MNRVIHRMTQFTSLFYLGLALLGKSVAAAPPQQTPQVDPVLRSPLHASRAPASANPLLESSGYQNKRPGVSLLQPLPKSQPRWRLMGTCRQDTGMYRSQNGLGYGDCNN